MQIKLQAAAARRQAACNIELLNAFIIFSMETEKGMINAFVPILDIRFNHTPLCVGTLMSALDTGAAHKYVFLAPFYSPSR